MILPRLALRNIARQKRRSVLTALMMIGGFFLSSVSMGISEGSYSNLIEKFTRAYTGHVQIHRQGYLNRPSIHKSFAFDDEAARRLDALPEVEASIRRVYAPALAFAGTRSTGVQVIGVEPRREEKMTGLANTISSGRFLAGNDDGEIVLGFGVARSLRLEPGDEVALVTQGADGSIANDLFRIAGIAGSGDDLRNRISCYVTLPAAQQFLSLGSRIHEVSLILPSHEMATAGAPRIAAALGDDELAVEPWQVVEREFYKAMTADIEGLWISLSIIMVIVAVGVLNTVLMTILERTREFGMLRAVGTRPKSIFALILLETSFLTLLSMVPAAALSLACNYVLSLSGIALPEPIDVAGFSFDRLLSSTAPRTLWIPAIVVAASALVVSTIPALRAARITPTDAMRSH